MSKFGELIDLEKPVLLDFYTEWSEKDTSTHQILKDVASALGDKAKVIKIDVDKNRALAGSLRVENLPCFILYKKGEMLWRQSGQQDAESLIAIVNKHI
ncbi:thioredoxin family protein [Mesonia ostreae]|uniref:Thioredoxin family protein n=1 Tax=Mesonia ostreae TaxID=861110 RepID=A0ABU2KFH0_9FLAO|nr:thioredoxin family protein [Mesonia ostreae]MDT0293424.1 thioredoxin family protein [Mesonia ostreae]